MKWKVAGSVLGIALVSMATVAWACPEESKTTTASGKGGCSHGAVTTVAVKDAKLAKSGKGCCAKKNATTVAAKDAKSAKGGCSKKCGSKAATVAAKSGGCKIGAKVDAILASLPAMKYQVGTQSFCCPKAAGFAAEKESKPVEFLIGEEKFAKEYEAEARLVSLLDTELQAMSSTQFAVGGECMRCPMSAKTLAKKNNSKVMYRVAGFDFADKVQAEQTVKLVSDAVAKVEMSYKVDGQSYKCSMTAGAKCKSSGTKMTYVVADQETNCATAAKMLLTQAKIRAAVETAAGSYAGAL